MNSLDILRKINETIKERHFHEHTHILYDIRTDLGNSKKTYLEIGSYVGSSAKLMLSHEFPTDVFCIDPCMLESSHYLGLKPQYETLKDNTDGKAVIIKGFSCDREILEKTKDIKIDILFIDGDHSYDAVINDFSNYIKNINYGGFIIFDDYLDFEYSPAVNPAVDHIVSKLNTRDYEIIGTPNNKFKAIPVLPERFIKLNEFVIKKRDDNLFAIVIATYKRKNGSTPGYLKGIAEMLKTQTFQKYHVFLIGDDYEDEVEFNSLVNFFDSDKIYSYNNKKSYRQNYFKMNINKWFIGGVMALYHGVNKAKEFGYKYYLHLDDDDQWTENKLEVLKDNINKYPEAEFIFHYSEYMCGRKTILPNYDSSIKIGYNNLTPKKENVVHSSFCLFLSDYCFELFNKYTTNILNVAENIKNSVIKEYSLSPYDAGFIDFINEQKLKVLFIPEILSFKYNDGNIPL